MSSQELSTLLFDLLSDKLRAKVGEVAASDVKWFMRNEFRSADTDRDGKIDWEEFASYCAQR